MGDKEDIYKDTQDYTQDDTQDETPVGMPVIEGTLVESDNYL